MNAIKDLQIINPTHLIKKIYMVEKLNFFILLTFASMNSYGGLFGPSNYEECVLDGLKNAKTEMAASLLSRVCHQKFPKKYQPVIDECSITLNGKTFTSGKPKNLSDYSIVTFTGSSDKLYVPNDEIGNLKRSLLTSEKKKINSLCPRINLQE